MATDLLGSSWPEEGEISLDLRPLPQKKQIEILEKKFLVGESIKDLELDDLVLFIKQNPQFSGFRKLGEIDFEDAAAETNKILILAACENCKYKTDLMKHQVLTLKDENTPIRSPLEYSPPHGTSFLENIPSFDEYLLDVSTPCSTSKDLLRQEPKTFWDNLAKHIVEEIIQDKKNSLQGGIEQLDNSAKAIETHILTCMSHLQNLNEQSSEFLNCEFTKFCQALKETSVDKRLIGKLVNLQLEILSKNRELEFEMCEIHKLHCVQQD